MAAPLLSAVMLVELYGAGSSISGSPPIDFTGDLKEIDGKPIAKRGRIPGIKNNARVKRVGKKCSKQRDSLLMQTRGCCLLIINQGA